MGDQPQTKPSPSGSSLKSSLSGPPAARKARWAASGFPYLRHLWDALERDDLLNRRSPILCVVERANAAGFTPSVRRGKGFASRRLHGRNDLTLRSLIVSGGFNGSFQRGHKCGIPALGRNAGCVLKPLLLNLLIDRNYIGRLAG